MENKKIYTENGVLFKEVVYDSEKDYTENIFREDGNIKTSKTHRDNKYEYSNSTTEYAEDGETVLRETSYLHDSNGKDHSSMEIYNLAGKKVFVAHYDEEEGPQRNEYVRMERAYYDLDSNKRISNDEFFKQLDEKYQDGDDIITELGISKYDLLGLVNEYIGFEKYFENGILTDNDLDNYYVVDLYYMEDGSIVKDCDNRDGLNYSESKYNADGELIEQKVTKNGETKIVADKDNHNFVKEIMGLAEQKDAAEDKNKKAEELENEYKKQVPEKGMRV